MRVIEHIMSSTLELLEENSPDHDTAVMYTFLRPKVQQAVPLKWSNVQLCLKRMSEPSAESQTISLRQRPKREASAKNNSKQVGVPFQKSSDVSKQSKPYSKSQLSPKNKAKQASFRELPKRKTRAQLETTSSSGMSYLLTARRLRLVPVKMNQLIKCPRRNQPVVVLNHPDVDSPEIINVMKTINKYKGQVLKVVLSERTRSCLGVKRYRKRLTLQNAEAGNQAKKQSMLKMKLKKTHKNNYQVLLTADRSIEGKELTGKRILCCPREPEGAKALVGMPKANKKIYFKILTLKEHSNHFSSCIKDISMTLVSLVANNSSKGVIKHSNCNKWQIWDQLISELGFMKNCVICVKAGDQRSQSLRKTKDSYGKYYHIITKKMEYNENQKQTTEAIILMMNLYVWDENMHISFIKYSIKIGLQNSVRHSKMRCYLPLCKKTPISPEDCLPFMAKDISDQKFDLMYIEGASPSKQKRARIKALCPPANPQRPLCSQQLARFQFSTLHPAGSSIT
ncbi:hypothetical protein IHE44_0012909 [Lamprotornis superbus]|uniref:Uncharacterized protein n=1 Tax=Lamprotornis superbus TaxID=245042 RepID=A0A835TV30_9PASS|nr:hypothetical protein IHE44_0012909 [Lamprotornis superbus]